MISAQFYKTQLHLSILSLLCDSRIPSRAKERKTVTNIKSGPPVGNTNTAEKWRQHSFSPPISSSPQ
ncbi:hypothetical protein V5799_019448 [Amblyomma americanum]|uniref:Uncharacterized protein n=1 Tax=Amblyomma americanum TaxID=6943 RepID=A0AAQ4EX85_AMBAM